jgi:steroid delta-isomerase
VSTETAADHVRRYGEFWERLQPETVSVLKSLAVEDLHFRDPFHDLVGVGQVTAMLQRMFAQLGEPRFTVTAQATTGGIAFYRWGFTATARGRPIRIDGVSEVHFDEAGLVVAHLDHWDAASQVYAEVPLLGGMLGWLKRRIAAG